MTFDEWWVSHPIKDLKVGPDDVKAAWDAAIAAERERCAKIADNRALDKSDNSWMAAEGIAAAIRVGKP